MSRSRKCGKMRLPPKGNMYLSKRCIINVSLLYFLVVSFVLMLSANAAPASTLNAIQKNKTEKRETLHGDDNGSDVDDESVSSGDGDEYKSMGKTITWEKLGRNDDDSAQFVGDIIIETATTSIPDGFGHKFSLLSTTSSGLVKLLLDKLNDEKNDANDDDEMVDKNKTNDSVTSMKSDTRSTSIFVSENIKALDDSNQVDNNKKPSEYINNIDIKENRTAANSDFSNGNDPSMENTQIIKKINLNDVNSMETQNPFIAFEMTTPSNPVDGVTFNSVPLNGDEVTSTTNDKMETRNPNLVFGLRDGFSSHQTDMPLSSTRMIMVNQFTNKATPSSIPVTMAITTTMPNEDGKYDKRVTETIDVRKTEERSPLNSSDNIIINSGGKNNSNNNNNGNSSNNNNNQNINDGIKTINKIYKNENEIGNDGVKHHKNKAQSNDVSNSYGKRIDALTPHPRKDTIDNEILEKISEIVNVTEASATTAAFIIESNDSTSGYGGSPLVTSSPVSETTIFSVKDNEILNGNGRGRGSKGISNSDHIFAGGGGNDDDDGGGGDNEGEGIDDAGGVSLEKFEIPITENVLTSTRNNKLDIEIEKSHFPDIVTNIPNILKTTKRIDAETETPSFRVITSTERNDEQTPDVIENRFENGVTMSTTEFSTNWYATESVTSTEKTKPENIILSIEDFDENITKANEEDIFDIITDDVVDTTINTAKNDNLNNKIVVSDSEEFFIPADIKERETTTIMPKIETTTAPIATESQINNNNPSTVEHDADTIFFISNTEVKVLETAPTPNTKQENQFFPAIYEEDVIIDFSSKNISGWGSIPDKYEEDIILSPLKSNFDPTKLGDDNLSISYVGESFIEVKESKNGVSNEQTMATASMAQQPNASQSPSSSTAYEHIVPLPSDVIIQPVQMAETPLSIGVPVIAELPPQIQLKPISYDNRYGIELSRNGGGGIMGVNAGDDDAVTSEILMPSGDNLQQKNHLTAEIPIDKNMKIVSKRNGTVANATSGNESTSNVTAYSVLDDEPEYTFLGFNDVQTLFLACVATVVPLILCVLLVFGVRYFWRKYRRQHSTSNGIIGDISTDPLAVKSRTMSTDELKSTESGFAINRSSDTLESSTELVSKFDATSAAPPTSGIANGSTGGGGGNGTGNGGGSGGNNAAAANKMNHSGANGSVITMTLKNNHLIVETEERNDMARDARETKMHYSPSEKDGVFVVEVARGADSSGVCNGPIHPQTSQHNECGPIKQNGLHQIDEEPTKTREDGTILNNEDVQVHPPPDGISEDEILTIDEDGAVSMSSLKLNGDDSMRPICGSANTGLSQSDLSITSSCGSNKDYCYGSQQHYTVESKGYQSASPRNPKDNIVPVSPNNNKPIIKAAIYKQESLEPGSPRPPDHETNSNVSPLINNLRPNLKEDILIEEQTQLGNGTIVETSMLKETNGQLNNCDIPENGEEYDSLINLPAPPSTDEIKYLNTDITILDNNNMDSLPPPPPPEVVVDGPANGQS